MGSNRIIVDATTTVTGTSRELNTPYATFQANVVGSGAVTATVVCEGSNDDSFYSTLGTISLAGTTSASDGFTITAPWAYVRARVTAISGTSATVNVYLGVI